MKEALDFIGAHSAFVLACHVNPDGDAVGSLLAGRRLLLALGKRAQAYSHDPVPPFARFLPEAEQIHHQVRGLDPSAAVIVLDSGDLERTGREFADFAASRPLLNLDHHQTNDRFGNANWVEPTASSTCEMIGLLAQTLHAPLSPDLAACIYTGILTDTGSFQFSNTSPQALRLAADMIAAGARPVAIADAYYHSRPASHLQLLALVLSTLEFNPEFTRGELTVTCQHFQQTNTGPEAVEGIINFLTDVASVKIAVIYRESGPGKWKVSLRSKGELNVAEVAELFQGGGHKNAAGCHLGGGLAEVKERIRAAVAPLLDHR